MKVFERKTNPKLDAALLPFKQKIYSDRNRGQAQYDAWCTEYAESVDGAQLQSSINYLRAHEQQISETQYRYLLDFVEKNALLKKNSMRLIAWLVT